MIDWFVLIGIVIAWAQSKKFWPLVVMLAVSSIFVFFGFVHIVSGSDYHRSAIVQKLSFGFSETFINADHIKALPYIAATFQFPLSILALQRVGYLETDQERATRIEAKNKAALARIQAESEEQIRKSQADMTAALEALLMLSPESRSGAAVLVKEAEKPTVTVFDGKAIRVDGASLEVVKKNVGNHPGQLLWVDSFAAQLKVALGKDYLDMESGLSGTSATMIEGQGDYYYGEACMLYSCPDKEAAIAIHSITGEVVVGVKIKNTTKVFGVVDASHSPPPIQTWLATLQR